MRADTGAPISIQALTPSEVIITPTEPLLIEVEALGDYDGIQWTIDSSPMSTTSLQNFWQRIYISETSEGDTGLYEVVLSSTTYGMQVLNFSVFLYGKLN